MNEEDRTMPLLSERSLESIAKMFVGDEGELFHYLSGPQIVTFFNDHFDFRDIYQGGNAPTRWRYAAGKIASVASSGRLDRFFSIVLGFKYMVSTFGCDEIEARERADKAKKRFNQVLISDELEIVGTDGEMKLVVIDSDLIPIGKGGFAEAFRQKSTGRVLKKLMPEVALDARNRHRFKREYEIMNDLSELPGVLRVFDFDESNCSYTMEAGETTLLEFMDNPLSEQVKMSIIEQIVGTMAAIHSRGYIHRDLSPTNIFLLSGQLKIADFGLGKNLNTLSSYQTTNTNNYGQWFYCSPEQLVYLKDGDKRSDVFSLGRIINFVLAGHPTKTNHRLRPLVEKATADDPSKRYQDAAEFLSAIKRRLSSIADADRETKLAEKAARGILDGEAAEWILEMTDEQLCSRVASNPAFAKTVVKFTEIDNGNAAFVMDAIDQSMTQVCKTWEDHDPFADIAKSIVLSKAPYDIKERACQTLSYVAWQINRFHAQHLIEDIITSGIDPMLEDLLNDSV